LSLTSWLNARLPKHGFWRNLSVVAGGSAVGQALSVVAAPLLSRLYNPSDFGALALFTSMTSIAGAVSTLGYHFAISSPERDEDAADVLVVSILCVLACAPIAAAVALLFRGQILEWMKSPNFGGYLWAVPIGIVGIGVYEALTQWAARKKSFGLIGKTAAGRSLTQVAGQLSGGALHLGATGLIASQLLGQWGGIGRIARETWKHDASNFLHMRWRTLRAAAFLHRRFPMYSAPAILLSVLELNTTPLLFAHFFGSAVVGYYALGDRLMTIPVSLIANAAQKVFFPAAAVAEREGRLKDETLQTLRRLVRVVLPVVFLLAAAAPELFVVALGQQWREAGVYTRWIAARTCMSLVVFPIIPVLYVRQKQSASTAFHGLQLAVRLAAIYAGARVGSSHLAVAFLGAGTGFFWLIYLAYILVVSGNKLFTTAKVVGVESATALALVSPVIGAKVLGLPALVVAIVAAVDGALMALFVGRRIVSELREAP